MRDPSRPLMQAHGGLATAQTDGVNIGTQRLRPHRFRREEAERAEGVEASPRGRDGPPLTQDLI